ncbi:ead/Ea22-like family protein [Enterobacter hormaechei]|nr:ead/Ea22-like family protein [Enterobacter hormaechei]MCN2932091.1 ead/Ea22-like family protein [Escherichia coli]DAL41593.1 MAG TPA_asm: Ead/Ea22-like protein [Caudoviricetes sp.]MCC9370321.1 ead/Ea22-like family protein [Enterobacter hormaechei subsp. oharae]MCC9410541.1 ead/Ea22-like family protein [Enterobacter hormaechei subsp. oharae]MCK7278075.1 ead/Ea22-like family protein [Enterobacter hormaechei]
MSNIDKQALREVAERAESDSWGYDRDEFNEALTPSTVLALLDELEAKDKQIDDLKATAAHSNAGWTEAHRQEARAEAAEKRIADQCGIIASARKFISEYAGLGDVGAAEFIKIIDRAAVGKGEAS